MTPRMRLLIRIVSFPLAVPVLLIGCVSYVVNCIFDAWGES